MSWSYTCYGCLISDSVKELKKKTFVLKEGCSYRMRVYFYVQRDIVTGLRFTQRSFRKGIQGTYVENNLLAMCENRYFTNYLVFLLFFNVEALQKLD